MTGKAYTTRVNIGGNFCGHDPAQPKFTLLHPAKVGKEGLPRVLTLCMERITGYYSRPRAVIPSLDLANGKDRQQRSERREACICLLAAILKYTDLASLRVGIPTSDGFRSLTVAFLARQTGLTLKRIERAMSDLKSAGLLTISQPRQLLQNGKWVGLAAVKAVSHNLFGIFGLKVMLKKERDKAAKRLKQKSNDWQKEKEKNGKGTITSKSRLNLFLGSLTGGSGGKGRLPRPPDTKPPKDTEYRKQVMALSLWLKGQNPDWDGARCNHEAMKQLAEQPLQVKK